MNARFLFFVPKMLFLGICRYLKYWSATLLAQSNAAIPKKKKKTHKRLQFVKNIIPTWPWSAQILVRSHCGKRCQSEHQQRAACPGWTPAGAWNSQIYPALSLGADNCNRKDYPCLPDIKTTSALKPQMLWSPKTKENVPDQSLPASPWKYKTHYYLILF